MEVARLAYPDRNCGRPHHMGDGRERWIMLLELLRQRVGNAELADQRIRLGNGSHNTRTTTKLANVITTDIVAAAYVSTSVIEGPRGGICNPPRTIGQRVSIRHWL